MSETAESTQKTLTVPESLDGARLDKALTVLASVSRSGAKAMLEAGVRVNGKRAVKGSVVKAGDTLEIASGDEDGDPSALPDPDVELDIRLEADAVIVVHKPPRLPSAPLRGGERGTLANGLVARFPEIAEVGADRREPGMVHRLDTDTSGVVIVARNQKAFDEIKTALRDGKIEKHYLAIVAPGTASNRASSVGVAASEGPLPDSGTIDIPIAPHPKDKRRVFACVHPRDVHRLKPRDAVTEYKVIKRWETPEGESRALVDATASRALRHQIRVHFAAIGAPLVGDGLYGGPSAPDLGRHALHANRVGYPGGANVKPFVVDTPLPDDMAALLPE
jgi:23S rRNA pseudouridine1911/1915/1917 synthase